MALKLDPLDKEKLEGEVINFEIKTKPPCKHSFEYVSSQEVECVNCKMGLYIEVGDILTDGHLFRGSKLVV